MAVDPKAQRLRALAAYQLLKAKATSVLGTTTANKELLSVLAKAAILASRSSYESLAVAVEASLLQAVTKTGKFFILLEPVENIHTIESRSVQMGRLTRDDFRAIEQAYVSLSKPLSSAFSTSDSSLVFTGKNVFNTAATSDAKTIRSVKSLADIGRLMDSAKQEVGKARSDVSQTSDATVSEFGKNPQDAAHTQDTLARVVSYVRFFDETLDATDSVSVVAVMDDGEVMHLGKAVIDYTSTSTYQEFDLRKSLLDTTISSDLWVKAFNKPLADDPISSTYTQYDISTPRADSFSAIERAIYSLAKLVVDYMSTSDAETRHFEKSINDFVRTSDALTFATALGKFEYLSAPDLADVIRIAAAGVPPQIEHLHVGDVAGVLAHKFFHELIDATDDFLHEMTVDDDQTVTFKKNVPEVLHTVERRSFSMQRGNAETLGANDSGVLFWTDYCDSTYFSQSFVGNERTFT